MKEPEKTILTVIFGWSLRRVVSVFAASSALSMLIFAGLAMLPTESNDPTRWQDVVMVALGFSALLTCGAYSYFRFVKGPATLARLRSKDKIEAIEFCETLMKPNKRMKVTSL